MPDSSPPPERGAAVLAALPSIPATARRAAAVGGVVLGLVLLGLLLWKAVPALLLIFGAVLVALLLSGLAGGIERRTPLGYRASLAVGGLIVVGVLGGAGWFLGAGLAEQVAGVGEALPAGLERAEALVRGTFLRVGAEPGAVPPVSDALPGPRVVAQHALGIAGGVLGVLSSVVLMILLGVFLASSPDTYRTGLVHLIPKARRARAGEVLDAVGRAVRQWLTARLIVMVLTFFVVWGGLSLIGVPFAAGLAVLSALVVFVPYVGPYISGAAAVLVALLDGPQTALYTALFYLAVENIQGWTVEPLIESKLTAAPPGLLLMSQIVLSVLLGAVGLILASPLVVAATVAVQMLYVEDVLGDHSVEVLAAE